MENRPFVFGLDFWSKRWHGLGIEIVTIRRTLYHTFTVAATAGSRLREYPSPVGPNPPPLEAT